MCLRCLVETLSLLVWVSVQCGQLPKSNGSFRPTLKKQSWRGKVTNPNALQMQFDPSLTSCRDGDVKMSKSACNFCMQCSTGKDQVGGTFCSSESRNVTATALSSVSRECHVNVAGKHWRTAVISWIHQQSSGITPPISSLLRQPLPWPSFTPTPLSQTHPASLHDSLATSVWH